MAQRKDSPNRPPAKGGDENPVVPGNAKSSGKGGGRSASAGASSTRTPG